MRKSTVIALTLMASVPLMGATQACTSSWWANFSSNPAAVATAFEQGVQVVLNDAQLAWNSIQPFLPAGTAATINAQFNNAVFAVNHALTALNDAIAVAVAAQNSNPNFTAIMATVTDAVAQVIAIIDQYTASSPAPVAVADGGAAQVATPNVGKAPMSPALVDAHAGLASLKAHYLPVVKATVAAPAKH
jgi:hypothetical protein